MIPGDIESLRQLLSDQRLWIGIGVVTQVEMASDRSLSRAKVMLYPDQREVIAVAASSGGTGPNAGIYMLPVADDLVLVANANGNDDSCYIISRLSSKEDKIPANAEPGAAIMKALAGKKAWVTSDTQINLSKGDTAPTEALVLGGVLKTFLEALFDAFINAPEIGTCAVGPVAMSPALKAQLTAQKTQYLATAATNILSQLAFTERGT